MATFSVRVQKAVGIMTNVGTETFHHITTVKAYGYEEIAGLKFAIENQNCFLYGRVKGYFWCCYFMSNTFLGSGGDVAMIYIMSRVYSTYGLSVGEITAILMYVRLIQMQSW